MEYLDNEENENNIIQILHNVSLKMTVRVITNQKVIEREKVIWLSIVKSPYSLTSALSNLMAMELIV